MTAFTYTARRSLTGGHVADSDYSIDLSCVSIDRQKDNRKTEQRALSTKTSTLLWRNSDRWQITTKAVRGQERLGVLEFLESVVGGEGFTFDEFGTIAQPDNAVAVILEGDYRETRAVRQGDGGRDDYFRYSFRIRKV